MVQPGKIRVIVIDDSPLMRNLLAQAISGAPDFEVVATAHNAADAWTKIQSEGPDVVTLDVEMPDMNGITFLERLMQMRPLPVVMVSALTQSGAQTTLRALQLGAADFIGKPSNNHHHAGADWLVELLTKLRRASTLRPARVTQTQSSDKLAAATMGGPSQLGNSRKCLGRLIVVGCGSGGVQALSQLLMSFPRDCPPVIVAQQIPEILTKALLARMSRVSGVQLSIGIDQDRLTRGRVILAPEEVHIAVAQVGPELRVRLHSGEQMRGNRPSINFLFESAAKASVPNTVGILLDSAGNDGESGLLLLETSGAKTIRQSTAALTQAVNTNDDESDLPRHAPSRGNRPRVSTLREIPDLLFGSGSSVFWQSQP